METRDAISTPIITAALARRPRRNPRPVHRTGGEGGAKKTPHNYLAQAPKKQAGAPLGNRRAARRDDRSVERQLELDALIQQSCDLADMVIATIGVAQQERARLIAPLAETPRV